MQILSGPDAVIVGSMSGTSLDGIDAAALQLTGDWPNLECKLIGTASRPLGSAADTLQRLIEGAPLTAQDIAKANRKLSESTASAMLSALNGHRPTLAAVHGQTIMHSPPDSWQLIDAQRIASILNCPVASHLRGGDLACGGEGAPVTPLADWVLFQSQKPRAIINLGGFCNITWLPGNGKPDAIQGADICPCNHLLNAAARHLIGQPFDNQGALASSGEPDPTLVKSLVQHCMQIMDTPRSLGSGDEGLAWLQRILKTDVTAPTLMASITTALGQIIGEAAHRHGPTECVAAGGSSRNTALMRAIEDAAGTSVRTTADFGIPIESREAACMALLAACDARDLPITLSHITGRRPDHVTSMMWCRPYA